MAVLLGMWMVVELDVVPTEEETGRLPTKGNWIINQIIR